jgi:Family of unknown function (DUF6483)
MIRSDYFLRMIEDFIQALARIDALKKRRRWEEADEVLDAEFRRLVGDGAQAVARRSETELLALLMQDGPTQLVRHKAFILTTLLKEAGDVAAARDQAEQSRECYLKALHLLLGTLGRGEVFECPEFVPGVEMLRAALTDVALPLRTQAMLMQHYERTGEFGRAEDALFAMLDTEPDNTGLLEFGLMFYRRLLSRSDAALADGNLSRAEVEQGLRDLQARLNGAP